MLDRHGVEAAASAASLGMLADDALMALVHYQKGADLSTRDRQALERASEVFGAIKDLGNRQVVVRSTLRDMAPVGVLDETFQALAHARDAETREDLASGLNRFQETILNVMKGKASQESAEDLRKFLDRLGAITLARSDVLSRPGPEERGRWIREALGL